MWTYLFIFLAGCTCGAGTVIVWKAFQLLADLRATNRDTEAALAALHGTPRDEDAQRSVQDCKTRLRWTKDMNPEWFQPLIEEVPRLVRDIASIYYPDNPQPLLGPGLSHFTRAVHLAASDVADFLQQRTVGRLVDVSANTAISAIQKGKQMVENEHFQWASKWYRRLLPIWQAVRYKSPVMWAGLAVSNVAVRALQPAVIDIVARRTIELYSGRLAAGKSLEALMPEAAAPPTESNESP
jgi:hypothetical protein